ncbi:calcium-binding protein [Microvirga pudoricolor]|uniref:calcium-binding protein n=1 Tax=Microvirga pudoricolor TaxID=2778729 RepID=UPI001950A1DF|nr:calcium-binding protein [Microvirga pudoricolor]MBM6593823.1 calcium-binding protein [Microvirga pudoricolor]
MAVTTARTLGYSTGGGPLQFEPAQYISDSASDVVRAGNGPNELFGQKGNDTLYGLDGNDLLFGGPGRDILYGGKGADYFVFDTSPKANNVDLVKDFNRQEGDKIVLALKFHKGLREALATDASGTVKTTSDFALDAKTATLRKSSFVAGKTALEADDRLIYDRASGVLSYDPDGNGALAAVQIARFKAGFALKHSDIVIY